MTPSKSGLDPSHITQPLKTKKEQSYSQKALPVTKDFSLRKHVTSTRSSTTKILSLYTHLPQHFRILLVPHPTPSFPLPSRLVLLHQRIYYEYHDLLQSRLHSTQTLESGIVL